MTIELAVGLLSLCALLALLIPLAHLGLTRASLCSAVREGARSLALGASAEEAQAEAERMHGGPLALSSQREGRWLHVSVSAPWGISLLHTQASCEVEAPLEERAP